MTDRSKRGPAWSPSRRELRLWLIGVLAGVYAAVWSQLPEVDASAGTETLATASSPVWLDTLPAVERPAIVVPEGWTLASRSSARAEPTRVAGRAARRVRTRSS